MVDQQGSQGLEAYANSIKSLKKRAEEAGVSETEFKRLYYESLNSIKNNPPERIDTTRGSHKLRFLILGVILSVCIRYYYKDIYSNLQECIYPGLKLLRRISIPIISLFPSLTEYYHETCLVQNPFFTVVDMDCWPCSTVNDVREVYNPSAGTQQNGAPFIYETDQQVINLDNLRGIYNKHKELFEIEAPKVLINNKYYITPQDLFKRHLLDTTDYYIWRLNNMNVARVIRQYIPRPKIVPKFGQSLERFIILDSSQQMFHVPDTECNFSFLLVLSGSRTIYLNPAEECKHQCKVIKVDMKETYLLWYNWWYWRPVFQPSNGNTTLIAHVGSYC